MLTIMPAGGRPLRGWGLAAATGLCSLVVADIWHNGRHYQQKANWTGALEPLADLGSTEQHGNRLAFQLDSEYLGDAILPHNSSGMIADWLTSGSFPLGQPTNADIPVRFIDQRTGANVLLSYSVNTPERAAKL